MLTGNIDGVEVGEGILRIPVGYHYVSAPNTETPADILASGEPYLVDIQQVAQIPAIGEYRNMQGGVVNGEYAYFTMRLGYDDKGSYVVKYDLQTFTEVGRSESLMLDHANDIAYVDDTNELYVVHCSPDSRKLTVLDSDTLAVKRTASFGAESGAYALDYSAEKGQFVSAVNKTGMCFYTDKMSFIRYVQPAQKTTLTLQGICTDGKYVYHVLYSPSSNQEEPENMIFVYDWNGKYIAKIPIGIKAYEPENISLVGDTFYIGCNNPTWTGGVVFTARLVRE